MDIKSILGIAGIVVCIASAAPYYVAIARHEIKPHSISWFIWALTMAIEVVAQALNAAGAGLWILAFYALSCFVIGISGLFIGERHITRGDWASLGFALAAIPLWIFTKNPIGSVVLIAAIDTVGFYPTIRKSWDDPTHENATAFVWGAGGLALSVAALDSYAFVNWFYPTVMVVSNITLVSILLIRRRALKRVAA